MSTQPLAGSGSGPTRSTIEALATILGEDLSAMRQHWQRLMAEATMASNLRSIQCEQALIARLFDTRDMIDADHMALISRHESYIKTTKDAAKNPAALGLTADALAVGLATAEKEIARLRAQWAARVAPIDKAIAAHRRTQANIFARALRSHCPDFTAPLGPVSVSHSTGRGDDQGWGPRLS